jgi:hypothetical protein
MVQTFGWQLDDWQRLGAGTVVGHLLECAAQVTGGYFADPGVKFVFDPGHYAAVKTQITPDLLKAQFGGLLKGEVRRYEIEHLHAFNYVMTDALEGGVNSSLNLDTHGKSWSFLILSLMIDLAD